MKLYEKALFLEENKDSYKLSCKNVKNFQRLMDYNINLKLIEPEVDVKVVSAHKDEKYKLEIHILCNEKVRQKMLSCQMSIVIVVKSENINVIKATDSNYTIEDKKVVYNLNNFNNNQKFLIGVMFQTTEPNFVEVVKLNYTYMVE
jgi:hypothetical protein